MKKVLLSLFVFSSVVGCGSGYKINTTDDTLRNAFLAGKPNTWSYHPNGFDIETGEEWYNRNYGWSRDYNRRNGLPDHYSPKERKGEKYERGQSPYERKLREQRETEMKGTQNES